MGTSRKLRQVSRFLAALEEENIRFMLIGMSAAIVQGVMETTLDVDLWIDLPSRQYMRLHIIANQQGGAMGATTVNYLKDGTPLNFVFEVDGLGTGCGAGVATLRPATFRPSSQPSPCPGEGAIQGAACQVWALIPPPAFPAPAPPPPDPRTAA